MRIAVVAPSCTLKPEAAEAVQALVAGRGGCDLFIHPQCFLSEGHFAGPDEARLAALREVIEQHGGRVDLHSEEGRGSKFSFTLPRL